MHQKLNPLISSITPQSRSSQNVTGEMAATPFSSKLQTLLIKPRPSPVDTINIFSAWKRFHPAHLVFNIPHQHTKSKGLSFFFPVSM